MNLEKEVNGIVSFIQKEVTAANKTGCVVGLSGGIDSAVIALLCAKAFPQTTTCISLPRFTYQQTSTQRAEILCEQAGLPLIKEKIQVDNFLEEYYKRNQAKNPQAVKMAEGNLSARLRMAKLYFYAEMLCSLVVGTDNKCENYIGYFTKYGDGGVDINPIGQYYKSEVFELGRYLNVPEEILKAVPSAELFENHTDEDEMGFTYDELEKAIKYKEAVETIKLSNREKSVVDNVAIMNFNTEHKRMIPKEYIRG